MDELKNVCNKIPLLQDLKDVPIHAKVVKYVCTKNPWRKKQNLKTKQNSC